MKINPSAAASIHRHSSDVPPARAARTALESRPDLDDQPFGQLVSKIARGESLPAAPQALIPEPPAE